MIKLSQLKKAPSPMLFTVSGMVMLVNAVQPLNSYLPMHATLLGITIFVK